jgi:hypothetical protein
MRFREPTTQSFYALWDATEGSYLTVGQVSQDLPPGLGAAILVFPTRPNAMEGMVALSKLKGLSSTATLEVQTFPQLS